MKLLKRLSLIVLLVMILVIGVVGFLGYQQYREVISRVPLRDRLEQIEKQPTYVPFEELSPTLVQATIAIEDRRFYDHNGIDVIATARALLNNLINKDIVGGGSTITQQLAKNLYFGYEPSFIRKIAELFVVHDLEGSYTKEELFAYYVNIINYGDHHMGIYDAANGYFKAEPAVLDLAQSSMLAGLPQSPSNYQLSDHFELAKWRQKQVLQAMVDEGYITEAEMKQAYDQPLLE